MRRGGLEGEDGGQLRGPDEIPCGAASPATIVEVGDRTER